jgi:hypothetical protein
LSRSPSVTADEPKTNPKSNKQRIHVGAAHSLAHSITYADFTLQGFEAIKQLLLQSQPYRIILGARNITTTQAAFDEVQYDRSANDLALLPLDLADLTGVRTFAQQTIEKLGQDKLDCLLLNAGMAHNCHQPGKHGLKWSEPYVVNHLCE